MCVRIEPRSGGFDVNTSGRRIFSPVAP